MPITLDVNNRTYQTDVEPTTPLLWTLRDALGILGPKFGCGAAQCGACTVHLDGKAVRSCVMPTSSIKGKVTTIEGIAATEIGRRVQAAWLEIDVAQCGYCQGGQIMSATALLAQTPKPTDAEIDAAMRGNICRCATYLRIRQAIKRASGQAET